jgi:hypothetical protein
LFSCSFDSDRIPLTGIDMRETLASAGASLVRSGTLDSAADCAAFCAASPFATLSVNTLAEGSSGMRFASCCPLTVTEWPIHRLSAYCGNICTHAMSRERRKVRVPHTLEATRRFTNAARSKRFPIDRASVRVR